MRSWRRSSKEFLRNTVSSCIGLHTALLVTGLAGTTNTDMPSGSMNITVNLDGAYFSAGVTTGQGVNIMGGTDEAQAFILLHELAHNMRAAGSAAGFIQQDTGIAPQTANNRLILQECGSTLDFVAGRR